MAEIFWSARPWPKAITNIVQVRASFFLFLLIFIIILVWELFFSQNIWIGVSPVGKSSEMSSCFFMGNTSIHTFLFPVNKFLVLQSHRQDLLFLYPLHI